MFKTRANVTCSSVHI